jgi:hypothetical protein
MEPDSGNTNEGGMSEAEIDETLEASFPASDPPSWTLGTDSHPARGRGDTERVEETGAPHPPTAKQSRRGKI